MSRRVLTVTSPCKCMYRCKHDNACSHYMSKTGVCSTCLDSCNFHDDCPLEELPDDESRTMEFKRSLEKYWSLKNNN